MEFGLIVVPVCFMKICSKRDIYIKLLNFSVSEHYSPKRGGKLYLTSISNSEVN